MTSPGAPSRCYHRLSKCSNGSALRQKIALPSQRLNSRAAGITQESQQMRPISIGILEILVIVLETNKMIFISQLMTLYFLLSWTVFKANYPARAAYQAAALPAVCSIF